MTKTKGHDFKTQGSLASALSNSHDLGFFAHDEEVSKFEAELLRLVKEMLSRVDKVARNQVSFQDKLEQQLRDLGTTFETNRQQEDSSGKDLSIVPNSSRRLKARSNDLRLNVQSTESMGSNSTKKVGFCSNQSEESLLSPKQVISKTCSSESGSPKDVISKTCSSGNNTSQCPSGCNPGSPENFLTWSSPCWNTFGDEDPPAAPKILQPRPLGGLASINEAVPMSSETSGDSKEKKEFKPTGSCNLTHAMSQALDYSRASLRHSRGSDGRSLSTSDSIQDGFMNGQHTSRTSIGSNDGMLQKAARRMGEIFHRRSRLTRKPRATMMEQQFPCRGDNSILSDSDNEFQCCCVDSDRYVLNPESYFRTCFDITSFLVLLYDAISIPIILAWDPSDNMELKVGMFLSACFWSTDLFLNFFTGYYVQGILVLQMNKIAQRYVKGYFIADAFLCFFDWFGLIMENVGTDSGTLGVLRVTKVHRLVRIIGVFRMSKIWTRIERINPYYFFEGFQIASEVTKIVALIVWINHLFCCMWYFLAAKVPSDTGVTWLDVWEQSSVGTSTYMERSMAYQYTTAYHWALTQMTPGSMQVFPQNSAERLLNIICLIVGLVFGTSLTSRLSAKMVQLQMSKQEQVMKMMKLRRYLKEHSISAALASRIQRHVQQHVSTKKPLFESQVTVLSLLTPTLRQDLRYDLFQPRLLQCPFLRVCSKIDESAMHSLCTIMGVRGLDTGSDGLLFGAGERARSTYIVVLGAFRYLPDDIRKAKSLQNSQTINSSPTMSLCPTVNTVKTANTAATVKTRYLGSMEELPEEALAHHDEFIVEPGRWMCEFAMWLNWTTRGTAEAAEPCEVLSIDVHKIAASLKRHMVVQSLYRTFCEAYAEVCDLDDDGTLDESLDDLGRGLLDSGQGEVITCMPIDSRERVAEPILEELKDRAWFYSSDRMVKQLENEVKSGKCAIFLDRDGNPERLALVVTVNVSRAIDTYQLVQLGRVKHDEVLPSLHLPFSRLRHLEKPAEAAHRILACEIGPLVPVPHFEVATRSIDSKTSSNITTKYIRTTFHVKVEGDEDAFDHSSHDLRFLNSGEDSAVTGKISQPKPEQDDAAPCVVAIPLGGGGLTKHHEKDERRSYQSKLMTGSSFIGTTWSTQQTQYPLKVRTSMVGTTKSMKNRLTMRMSRMSKSHQPSRISQMDSSRLPQKVYFVRESALMSAQRGRSDLEGHIYAWLHPDDYAYLQYDDASAYDLLSRMDQSLLSSVF